MRARVAACPISEASKPLASAAVRAKADVQGRRPADSACEAAGGLVSEGLCRRSPSRRCPESTKAASIVAGRAPSRAATSFSLLPSTGRMVTSAFGASANRRGSVWGRLWRQGWQTERLEELSPRAAGLLTVDDEGIRGCSPGSRS